MSEDSGSKTQSDLTRLSDKVTDQAILQGGQAIVKVAGQLLQAAAMFFLLSAATATDPFFRKHMGERYFTPFRAFIGFCGWLVMLFLAVPFYQAMASLAWEFSILRWAARFALNHQGVAFYSSFLILLAYGVRSHIQLKDIRCRQTSGEIWHSRSKGESIFGEEDYRRDVIVDVVAFVVLLLVTPACALFYAISRILGYIADAMAWAALYSRYLDIQDARIEAKFMESVLRDGFPPSRMGGLFGPMPKQFKDEHRANVARVVAAGVYGAATDSMPSIAENPVAAETPPTSAPTVNISDTGRKIFSATLGSRRFRVLIILAIVVAALGYGSIHIYRALRASWNHPATTQVAQAQPVQQANVNPPSTPPSQAPVVEAKPIPAPVAQTPVIPAPNDAAAQEQARLEKQKQLEAQQLQAQEEQRIKERNQNIGQIKTALENELAQVASFKATCLTTLDDNTNKIAKVSFLSRKALIQRNDDKRQDVIAELEKQERVLTHDQQSMQDLISDPDTDAQRFYNDVANAIGKMQINRQNFAADLNALSSDIAKAPASTPFFQINLK
jgi:hypothetical protein